MAQRVLPKYGSSDNQAVKLLINKCLHGVSGTEWTSASLSK